MRSIPCIVQIRIKGEEEVPLFKTNEGMALDDWKMSSLAVNAKNNSATVGVGGGSAAVFHSFFKCINIKATAMPNFSAVANFLAEWHIPPSLSPLSLLSNLKLNPWLECMMYYVQEFDRTGFEVPNSDKVIIRLVGQLIASNNQV